MDFEEAHKLSVPLSVESIEILVYAEKEARVRPSYFEPGTVDDGHLFLALLRHDGAAKKVLLALGADIDVIMKRVDKVLGRAQDTPTDDTPRSSGRLVLIIKQAELKALIGASRMIEPEHLLLAAVHNPDGLASGFLELYGITEEKVHDAIPYAKFSLDIIRLWLETTCTALTAHKDMDGENDVQIRRAEEQIKERQERGQDFAEKIELFSRRYTILQAWEKFKEGEGE